MAPRTRRSSLGQTVRRVVEEDTAEIPSGEGEAVGPDSRPTTAADTQQTPGVTVEPPPAAVAGSGSGPTASPSPEGISTSSSSTTLSTV